MFVFLLVIVLYQGQPRAAIEPMDSIAECEEVRVAVLSDAEDRGAKILKSECIAIQTQNS